MIRFVRLLVVVPTLWALLSAGAPPLQETAQTVRGGVSAHEPEDSWFYEPRILNSGESTKNYIAGWAVVRSKPSSDHWHKLKVGKWSPTSWKADWVCGRRGKGIRTYTYVTGGTRTYLEQGKCRKVANWYVDGVVKVFIPRPAHLPVLPTSFGGGKFSTSPVSAHNDGDSWWYAPAITNRSTSNSRWMKGFAVTRTRPSANHWHRLNPGKRSPVNWQVDWVCARTNKKTRTYVKPDGATKYHYLPRGECEKVAGWDGYASVKVRYYRTKTLGPVIPK